MSKKEKTTMSLIKVLEVIAQSRKGWEDAAQNAVSQASKTVRNIQHVYVEGLQAIVKNDKITEYRLNAKISFLVED